MKLVTRTLSRLDYLVRYARARVALRRIERTQRWVSSRIGGTVAEQVHAEWTRQALRSIAATPVTGRLDRDLRQRAERLLADLS